MNTPSPSRWGDLFDVAVSIIDQANAQGLVVDRWTLGGGTALMLQINHRESHDIDLFVDDPQLLALLNPETQGFDLHLRPSGYRSDGTQALKVVFDGVGEIDFICSPLLTRLVGSQFVRGRQVTLEDPREIIAKKIFHRGWNLQPRDMFDIAAVCQHFGEDYLVDALVPFGKSAVQALGVTNAFDRGLVGAILANLTVYDEFKGIISQAQSVTAKVLTKVIQRG